MKIYYSLLFLILLPFIVGVSISAEKKTSANHTIGSINPNHLDGAFTGGFGEETCRSCHFDYDLNMESGSLSVDGLNEEYEPGSEVDIIVTVRSEQLEIGGFQMTARHEDGSQAGSFEWDGDRLRFTPEISGDVQYIQHSEEGTEPTGEREVSWSFTWLAPETGESVIINVAANAGNYDDSSFGDWIYAKKITLKPAGT
ncbi:choice-of-anchor V domain-containing protein [Rhodohalobacter sp. 8-1]|uniref:choice-of-anchor V domain-containing protein n=1 Tax=Rhodohalobacter sp. 8-1 TaxID=3131972 RepID=UPI0030ED773D